MISTSFLDIKENLKENLLKLDLTTTDFLHVDIMDGIFVNNNTPSFDVYENLLKDLNTPLDIHLMVSNVKEYIEQFKLLKPVILTFHYEALNNHKDIIDTVKLLNIKVGLAISPNTSVDEIKALLPYVDLVLVMSVEPGCGGQEFIYDSILKIEQLKNFREENNYSYLIEVDGGINDVTAKLCVNADIIVVGSFITNGDNYQTNIEKIKKALDKK